MEQTRLEEFRRLLLDERERLTGMRDRLSERGLETTQGGALSELSTYDNHPADIGSETFERSKDLALRGQLDARLGAIDAALERIAAGSYGRCSGCGRPIGEERLRAVPETDLCRGCKERFEKEEAVRRRARPIEEELLSPPFGRTFTDDDRLDRDGNIGYDGEDAWQEVARYGTSETPADVPDGAGYERLYQDAYERRGGVTDLELLIDDERELQENREEEGPGRTGRG